MDEPTGAENTSESEPDDVLEIEANNPDKALEDDNVRKNDIAPERENGRMARKAEDASPSMDANYSDGPVRLQEWRNSASRRQRTCRCS